MPKTPHGTVSFTVAGGKQIIGALSSFAFTLTTESDRLRSPPGANAIVSANAVSAKEPRKSALLMDRLGKVQWCVSQAILREFGSGQHVNFNATTQRRHDARIRLLKSCVSAFSRLGVAHRPPSRQVLPPAPILPEGRAKVL